jgi:hypothetical protein
MNCRCTRAVQLLVMGLSLLPVRTALAHREDYIDETLVFQTLEEHAVEPEYWFDYGTRPEADFTRHNVALEYGITDHLMIDGRATVDDPDSGNANPLPPSLSRPALHSQF